MLDLLKDKKVVFFDVGYTLDRPASGGWMFTGKFLKLRRETAQKQKRTEVQP